MRIVIILSSKLPVPAVKGGAVETVIDQLLLENEKQKKHEFIVYSIYNEDAKVKSQKYKNTKFVYIKNNKVVDNLKRISLFILNKIVRYKLGNEYIRHVYKLLKKENYECIILENIPLMSIYIYRKQIKPVIVHLHNDSITQENRYSNDICQSVDAFFCVSEFISNRVISNINAKKVFTLYNGFELSSFLFDFNERVKTRNNLGFMENDTVFIYCGRIQPIKGVKEMVKAFLNYTLVDDNAKLLIIGGTDFKGSKSTPYYDEICRFADMSEGKIKMLGYIDNNKLSSYYSASDIGIIPSIINEASSLVSLEMLANGLPIIASDIGGIPEMLTGAVHELVKVDKFFVNNLTYKMKKISSSRNFKNLDKFSSKNFYDTFNLLLEKIF